MSAFPLLKLEWVSDSPPQARLTFEPDPDTWSFSPPYTRETLKAELSEIVERVLTQPGTTFTAATQQGLRAEVLFRLLQWTAFRGLEIPLISSLPPG